MTLRALTEFAYPTFPAGPASRMADPTPHFEIFCPEEGCKGTIQLGTGGGKEQECLYCEEEGLPHNPGGFRCSGKETHVYCSNECLEAIEGKGPHEWLPIEASPGVMRCVRVKMDAENFWEE